MFLPVRSSERSASDEDNAFDDRAADTGAGSQELHACTKGGADFVLECVHDNMHTAVRHMSADVHNAVYLPMIKEFTVGVKHHVNLGDYESMEVQASVTVNIEDDDFLEARAGVQDALKLLLADSFQSQKHPEWFAEIPRKKMKLQRAV